MPTQQPRSDLETGSLLLPLSMARYFLTRVFNVHAMGLNPSPSGEPLRFCVLLELGDGEVPYEFA